MEDTLAALSPAKILDTGFAFWNSKVLLSAVRMRLFTELGSESLTAEQLGDRLNLHPRAIYDFFDALVSLGFLERVGEGPAGKYLNTAETARFLDRNSPAYVGGILEMANDRLFRFWADLDTALKTGEPQNEIKHSKQSMFEVLYSDPERLEQFLVAMRGISAGNFAALAAKFDFSNYQTLCDIGGATGVLCSVVAREHSQLQCLSFDLPVVEPIAREWIKRDGAEDQVTAVSGDFFKDPFPQADVLTMGMILHDWNLEKKKYLIAKAYEALPKGGALIAIENIIDDARRENSFGLLMSLNMLIELGDAFDFSGSDFWSWCEEAGFERYEVLHLNGPCSAAIAYK